MIGTRKSVPNVPSIPMARPSEPANPAEARDIHWKMERHPRHRLLANLRFCSVPIKCFTPRSLSLRILYTRFTVPLLSMIIIKLPVNRKWRPDAEEAHDESTRSEKRIEFQQTALSPSIGIFVHGNGDTVMGMGSRRPDIRPNCRKG